ncbi:MAG TPA: anti-sigma factor [Candidatus Dormibacteraeota bacterium]|nr:anti-sigma factor [Candidatus Dormibacteraeota bacterium]
MSEHEELETSVAAWVLGALDAEEAETVRVHVEGCAGCREVVARLRRVVGALPLTAEEVTPPARLRDRVLAAATASPRTSVPVATRVRRPAPARSSPRMPAYALAAVAVVALLIGVLVGQITLRSPAPSQVARYTLTGHQEMSLAQASVIDLRQDGVALVDFRGLPAPRSGRVYEVWLIPAKGDPVPAAVFVPDSNGAKVVLVNRSLAGYTVMAVTEEAGPDGSQAPTQPPQLYGNIA